MAVGHHKMSHHHKMLRPENAATLPC